MGGTGKHYIARVLKMLEKEIHIGGVCPLVFSFFSSTYVNIAFKMFLFYIGL